MPQDKYVWTRRRRAFINKSVWRTDRDATSGACIARAIYNTMARSKLQHVDVILPLARSRCTWPRHAPPFSIAARLPKINTHLQNCTRVYVHTGENERTHRAYTHEREGNAIRYSYANQMILASARSALLSIGLICCIVTALNFFVTLVRSPARECIASCKNACGIFVYLHCVTRENASETKARYPHRSGFAYRGRKRNLNMSRIVSQCKIKILLQFVKESLIFLFLDYLC